MQPYNFTVTGSITSQKLNESALQQEIYDNETIEIKCKGVTRSGNNFIVYMAGVLPQTQEDELTAVVLAHSGEESEEELEAVEIKPTLGWKPSTVMGVAVTALHNQIKFKDWVIDQENGVHLQGVFAIWDDCKGGDRVWFAVLLTPADSQTTANALTGATSVFLPIGAINPLDPTTYGRATWYNPLYTEAQFIEFWDANPKTNPDTATLLEVHRISSVNDSTGEVTFQNGLIADRNSGTYVRCRVDEATIVTGSDGLEGGLAIHGTHQLMMRNELNVTPLLPYGTTLSIRIKTSSVDGGSTPRCFCVNFIFRKP